MRIIHIIPSAFNYFNDIRSQAFELVEGLNMFGATSDAVTIQYGSTIKKKVTQSIQAAAPSQSNTVSVRFHEVVDTLSQYDVVHVHCPILGEMSRIIAWKQAHPTTSLIITFYRAVQITDLFSWFVLWYNAYYLRKLFKLADVITYLEHRPDARSFRRVITPGTPEVVVDTTALFLDTDLTVDSDTIQLSPSQRQVWKFSYIYQQVTGSGSE